MCSNVQYMYFQSAFFAVFVGFIGLNIYLFISETNPSIHIKTYPWKPNPRFHLFHEAFTTSM